MKYPWNHSHTILRKLQIPDYGSSESWAQWYKKAWELLETAGLTKLETVLDLTRVRLRIATLCWLAHDFVAASQGDACYNNFGPSDWIASLDVDLLLVMSTAGGNARLSEAIKVYVDLPNADFDDDEEGIIAYDEDAIRGFQEAIFMIAMEEHRDQIVNVLTKGFGGEPQLFLSLYLACHDLELLVEEQKGKLEEKVEDLVDELERWFHHSEKVLTDFRYSEKQAEIERLKEYLDPDSLRESVLEQVSTGAFEISGVYDMQSSVERMRGLEWCLEGCPVQCTGEW